MAITKILEAYLAVDRRQRGTDSGKVCICGHFSIYRIRHRRQVGALPLSEERIECHGRRIAQMNLIDLRQKATNGPVDILSTAGRVARMNPFTFSRVAIWCLHAHHRKSHDARQKQTLSQPLMEQRLPLMPDAPQQRPEAEHATEHNQQPALPRHRAAQPKKRHRQHN